MKLLAWYGPNVLTGPYAAEEAQTSVKGMEENAIHAKYIELVSISS